MRSVQCIRLIGFVEKYLIFKICCPDKWNHYREHKNTSCFQMYFLWTWNRCRHKCSYKYTSNSTYRMSLWKCHCRCWQRFGNIRSETQESPGGMSHQESSSFTPGRISICIVSVARQPSLLRMSTIGVIWGVLPIMCSDITIYVNYERQLRAILSTRVQSSGYRLYFFAVKST